MYALVLSGGGAKGSYQIGVWKALRELKVDVSLVVGTSVGALNGAFFAQNQYEEAYNMWSNIKMKNVFEFDENLLDEINKIREEGFSTLNLKMIKQPLEKIIKDRGIDITPLRQMIDHFLDEDIIRKSNIDFGFVTFSITERKPLKLFLEDIPYGELKYYLMGSASVPGFSPDKEDNKRFIDGGIYDNFPIKMAIEKGYKEIIAVSLKPKRLKRYCGVDVTYIHPSNRLGSFLYFNKERSLINMEMGYLDALKAFDKLKGINYYFYNLPSEKEIFYCLNSLKEDEIKTITRLSIHRECLNHRILFEEAIPILSKIVSSSKKETYEDFILFISEYIAKELDVERLVKYDFYEFLKIINSHEIDNNSLNYAIIVILNALYRKLHA
ncbi:patatin-like phospholipase family protein [Mycoplasmatota bacterium]|nr:patatin-like phospholipase family protein [Mycoplasmatota bacterium]